MPMVTRTPGTGGSLAPLTSGLRVIPVDVLEDDKSYVLRADLPGMKRKTSMLKLTVRLFESARRRRTRKSGKMKGTSTTGRKHRPLRRSRFEH